MHPKVTIYCKLKASDITPDGHLDLLLEKENIEVLTILCKLIREYFLDREIYIFITLLGKSRYDK